MTKSMLMRRDIPIEGNPWDRQLKWEETPKNYEAFTIYRDLGASRTITAAGREYRRRYSLKPQKDGKEPLLYGWSSEFFWTERVNAFDAHMDAMELEKLRRRRITAARRHADAAERAQAMLAHPVRVWEDRMKEILAGQRVDELTLMSDEELLKLGRHTAALLADMQRAEVVALNPAVEDRTDETRTSMRGEVLRRVLQSPDAIGLLESIQFKVTEETS